MSRLVSLSAIGFLFLSATCAHAATTVALTTTVHAGANAEENALAANLLALLELEASQYSSIQVVERQQLDLALHELVLCGEGNEQRSLQLGKLSAAELILTAKLLKQEEDKIQHISVRITESLTGRIRGAMLTPIAESTIDETVREITQYLHAVVVAPEWGGVSISVAPFESLGRFDRLRPLERGLRDLVVASLRRYQGLQVLQRSEMEQLLQEIDLVRGGLIDRKHLPETLPSRAAAYHLRGKIDEQQQEDKRQLVVTMELIHSSSQRLIAVATLSLPPEKLSQELPEKLRLLVNAIRNRLGVKDPQQKQAAVQNEVDVLFSRSVADLYHFWRRKPRDFSHRDFRLPGLRIQHLTYGSRVPIDSSLGTALIWKSIDRLESVLYLQPDRRDAQFALAWCFCNHIEGLWRPERAQNLLESVVSANPSDPLSCQSLNLLAEMYFHHEQGHCKASDQSAAWQNVFQALTTMPEKYRDHEWSRLAQLLSMKFHVGSDNLEQKVRLLQFIAAIIEQEGGQRYPVFIYPAVKMAQELEQLENQPRIQTEARQLLRRWSTSEFGPLRAECLRCLAQREKDHEKAAQIYLQVAEIHRSDASRQGEHLHHSALLESIARLRQAGKSEEALKLLDSFSPSRTDSNSLLYGYHGLERGACLESLGRKREALETYVAYAENDEGLINNSDVEDRIERLGGVPLVSDRDIEVHYIQDPKKQSFPCEHIATDGRHIFVERYHQGIVGFSITDHSWEQLGGPASGVTCLAVDNGSLWVGTNDEGLWRCELATRKWKQLKALPDPAVVDILIHHGTTYASIGNRTSGGIVRIDSEELTFVYQEPAAPKACLYNLTADGNKLYGVNQVLYALDLKNDQWHCPIDDKTGRPIYLSFVHFDTSGLWGSHFGRELFLVGAKPETNLRFSEAWFPRGQNKAGYSVGFLRERDNQVWFSGSPWRRFMSVGLYRMNMQTGQFKIYGPREGFRAMSQCFEGAWLDDHLWLATSEGLAKVTLRNR